MYVAGGLAGEGLRFLAGMEGAEVGIVDGAGDAALAAVDKQERTQGRAVLGAIAWTWKSSRRKIRFWILGESRGWRGHRPLLTGGVYQSDE